MKIFLISINRTYQLFSIVLNPHRWGFIFTKQKRTYYYGFIFSINIFYFEMYIRIIYYKKSESNKIK